MSSVRPPSPASARSPFGRFSNASPVDLPSRVRRVARSPRIRPDDPRVHPRSGQIRARGRQGPGRGGERDAGGAEGPPPRGARAFVEHGGTRSERVGTSPRAIPARASDRVHRRSGRRGRRQSPRGRRGGAQEGRQAQSHARGSVDLPRAAAVEEGQPGRSQELLRRRDVSRAEQEGVAVHVDALSHHRQGQGCAGDGRAEGARRRIAQARQGCHQAGRHRRVQLVPVRHGVHDAVLRRGRHGPEQTLAISAVLRKRGKRRARGGREPREGRRRRLP